MRQRPEARRPPAVRPREHGGPAIGSEQGIAPNQEGRQGRWRPGHGEGGGRSGAGSLRFSPRAAAGDAGFLVAPGVGVPMPGRGGAGCTGLAGAAGVAVAPGRPTGPPAPATQARRDGGASGAEPRAGSPPGGGCRTADEGGTMPPARGLGSPPEVGGLRDAGTTAGPGPAPDAGGVPVGGEPAAPPGPAKSAG